MHPEWPRVFELAASIRAAGEQIVASVRSGEIELEAAHGAGDADPLVGRVFAVKVYEAVPGIGKVKARRTMEEVGVDEDTKLAEVSPEQRAAIASRFEELLTDS